MRTVVLTLGSRPDRLAAFRGRWVAGDGVAVASTLEPHWVSYRALWLGLVADTLVLEDDVTFRAGWQHALAAAVMDLPADWDLLYLGGQHVTPPVPVCPGLVRCTMTYRTHAILVRHTSVGRMLALTGHATTHWDERLAFAMRAGDVTAYAVSPWLAGQAAGRSDISGVVEPERWWD
jgi:hypothetical protein